MQIVGRADDLLMVKGIKVYPASIKEVAEAFRPAVSGELRIDLDAPPPKVEPPLRLTLEAGAGVSQDAFEALARKISERMHQLLSIRPAITLVPFGALPRSALKTKLIHLRDAG